MKAYLNGQFLPREKACISIDDRGLLFGDGIYEVIRVIEGRPFRLDAHLERMDRGMRALELHLPVEERDAIPDIMHRLLDANDLKSGEATIYLQITRGLSCPRTHAYSPGKNIPSVIITVSPFQPDYELQKKGAYVITGTDIRWSRCDLKTVNLLPNVMGASQVRNNDAFGILMVRDGFVTEGFNNNVFAVINGRLFTYPDSPYILSGITREVVFEIAREAGIPLALTPVSEEDIMNADEVFLTGTTTDIQPVIKIDEKIIAEGQPGPVTRLVQREFCKQLQ